MQTPKIRFIIPYFGELPVWFPAFLHSCRWNADVDWLFFCDRAFPSFAASNIHCVFLTLDEFNALASQQLQFEVKISSAYKLCDFKPAYGLIFAEYLQDYDFWGHCDIDTIMGDIHHFITPELLTHYDIISAQKERICGHFCLYKNTPKTNMLFTRSPDHRLLLRLAAIAGFDEGEMTNIVNQTADTGELKVYWLRRFANYKDPIDNGATAYLGAKTNHWHWQEGKLYHQSDEILYMHFMNWKQTLKQCSVNLTDSVNSFYISYSHVGLSRCDRPSLRSRIASLIIWYTEFWTRRLATLQHDLHNQGQVFVLQKVTRKLVRKLIRQPA